MLGVDAHKGMPQERLAVWEGSRAKRKKQYHIPNTTNSNEPAARDGTWRAEGREEVVSVALHRAAVSPRTKLPHGMCVKLA